MLGLLNNAPSYMNEFLTSYFYLKKDIILIDCEKWISENKFDTGLYDAIVQDHNPYFV